MTTPELPPLPRLAISADTWGTLSVHHDPERGGYVLAVDAIERERILIDRIAELEADAERYRWLAGKAHKDTAYDRYGNGAHWSIGFFASDGRHTLDAAIDATRST